MEKKVVNGVTQFTKIEVKGTKTAPHLSEGKVYSVDAKVAKNLLDKGFVTIDNANKKAMETALGVASEEKPAKEK